jgi:hypothetical protein
MSEKKKYEVLAELDDLLMMFGAALRYSMGRQTYITGATPGFIIDNLPLCNEKWLINFLEDCKRYEDDRASGLIHDNDCDYTHWMKLKAALVAEYKRRGYPRDHKHFRLEDDPRDTL